MGNKLKAESPEDDAKAVVVSFEGRWKTPLMENQVGVFFRKRGPTKPTDYIYVYAAAPVGGIIGRAKVKSQKRVSLSDAYALAKKGAITEKELKQYASHAYDLLAVELGDFEPFKKIVTRTQMLDDYECVAPQNFFCLSKWGKAKLDSLGGIKS